MFNKMKKIAFLACAALLTSVVLTGCKDKQAEPEAPQAASENVEEQGSNEVVKTQFAISLPNQVQKKGKMMPGTTVQLPDGSGDPQFQGMTGITLIPYAKQSAIAAGDKRIGKNINLTAGIASDALIAASNSKVFTDVAIPLTTASFLFYAKSAAATGTKFDYGSLIANNLADDESEVDGAKAISFDLEVIENDPDALMLTSAEGGKLMDYLSHVAKATDGTKAWSTYTVSENQALHDLYASFISIHGLSSFEVARIMTDLYQSLMPVSSPIAQAIKDSITAGAKSVSAEGVVTLKDDQVNFPGKYKLPEGSIDIRWDSSSDKFIKGLYSNMANPSTFVYPAQLWYYGNSTVQTANSSRQTQYDGVKDWAAILATHTDGVAVSARTRAVAVVSPIQYAVARLDVQVRLASASMADNSNLVEGAATNVDCSGGFPVTAVLVGGQRSVIWNFTAMTTGTEYTIYDNVMTASGMKAEKNGDAYSAANSTLVLENGTDNVQIAVEMLNDKADFYGYGNQLIPKNSKFYVVAQLDADKATETGGHVFKQDYTTTAKLTMTNLRNAYNTIPDLRTQKMELGFSVDLTWQSGHVYTIEL